MNIAEQFLQDRDLVALKRFYETTEDSEGYDIGKEAISRLAEIGCVQRSGSTNYYNITAFGLYILGYFDYELPLKADRDTPRVNPHPNHDSKGFRGLPSNDTHSPEFIPVANGAGKIKCRCGWESEVQDDGKIFEKDHYNASDDYKKHFTS